MDPCIRRQLAQRMAALIQRLRLRQEEEVRVNEAA